MNIVDQLSRSFCQLAATRYGIDLAGGLHLELKLNVDNRAQFGDVSLNIAMLLAKQVGKAPRVVAQELIDDSAGHEIAQLVERAEIAGPGFINLFLKPEVWQQYLVALLTKPEQTCGRGDAPVARSYQIEMVSANPTGPLHWGHGRGGIVGDVLGRVLKFLGHQVQNEFYINDAGNQISLLAQSLRARCLQELGKHEPIPDGGYAGAYLIETAKACLKEHGQGVVDNDLLFFRQYAVSAMLADIKTDLAQFGISFDHWFSETTLHTSGAIATALKELQAKQLVYEKDTALWFASTQFGDDKDRVVRKADGELTYIAADIAYHENKFKRGFDQLINIWGHDHHGYVRRMHATLQAMGYEADRLHVILYQLVTIKENDVAVRMSKRAGTFTMLRDVVQAVGTDVARFFYLNRKTDAPLEFDLALATTQSNENPVFYIQYAYVRTGSVLQKTAIDTSLAVWKTKDEQQVLAAVANLGDLEMVLLRKIACLVPLLRTIAQSYQVHLLATYTWELANQFHVYYGQAKIIDPTDAQRSAMRVLVTSAVRTTLAQCLALLGLTAPEVM